jgi:hypothetical protein
LTLALSGQNGPLLLGQEIDLVARLDQAAARFRIDP